MNAIQILEKDHKSAKSAIQEIGRSKGQKKKSLFEDFKEELERHDRVEEQVFYPAVQAHSLAGDVPAMDRQAHEAVGTALGLLEKMPIFDPRWDPTFRDMRIQLLRHFADEEGRIFLAVKKAMKPQELEDLGGKMRTFKAGRPQPA